MIKNGDQFVLCNNCGAAIHGSNEYCSECGLEIKGPGEEDIKQQSPEIFNEPYTFEECYRTKPLQCGLYRGMHGDLLLIKSSDDAYQNMHSIIESVAADYLPRVLEKSSDKIVMNWDAAWPSLSEWVQTDINGSMIIDMWLAIAGFVSLCHKQGVLVNHIHPDAIYVDVESNIPVFEHLEFFSYEADKSIVISTEGFSSPEARNGEWEKVGFHSDIYCLGKLLLFMVNPGSRHQLVNRPETYNDLRGLGIETGFAVGRCLRDTYEQRWDNVEDLLKFIRRDAQSDLQIFGFSETGYRKHNEDAIFYDTYKLVTSVGGYQVGIMILADGMGGLDKGEQASALAVDLVRSRINDGLRERFTSSCEVDKEFVSQLIETSLTECNSSLISEAHANEVRWGTTICAAIIIDDEVFIGYVGDSRIYIFDENSEILYVSEDHSLIGKRESTGDLTEEEALVHPDRNILYQALGLKAGIRVDGYHTKLRPGYRLLLCSDGISGPFLRRDMESMSRSFGDIQSLGYALFYEALERNSTDNCSLILAQIRKVGSINEVITSITQRTCGDRDRANDESVPDRSNHTTAGIEG